MLLLHHRCCRGCVCPLLAYPEHLDPDNQKFHESDSKHSETTNKNGCIGLPRIYFIPSIFLVGVFFTWKFGNRLNPPQLSNLMVVLEVGHVFLTPLKPKKTQPTFRGGFCVKRCRVYFGEFYTKIFQKGRWKSSVERFPTEGFAKWKKGEEVGTGGKTIKRWSVNYPPSNTPVGSWKWFCRGIGVIVDYCSFFVWFSRGRVVPILSQFSGQEPDP